MGNLNVGKSAILSRLTGLRIAVSDCPGAADTGRTVVVVVSLAVGGVLNAVL